MCNLLCPIMPGCTFCFWSASTDLWEMCELSVLDTINAVLFRYETITDMTEVDVFFCI